MKQHGVGRDQQRKADVGAAPGAVEGEGEHEMSCERAAEERQRQQAAFQLRFAPQGQRVEQREAQKQRPEAEIIKPGLGKVSEQHRKLHLGGLVGSGRRGQHQKQKAREEGQECAELPEAGPELLPEEAEGEKQQRHEDERDGGVFRPCSDNEGEDHIENAHGLPGLRPVEPEPGPGPQPEQAQHGAPEIVDRAVEPEEDLPELRLQHPHAAEDREQEQGAAPPAVPAGLCEQPDERREHPGVADVEDPLGQHQEELHQRVREHASVHRMPVRRHRGQDRADGGDAAAVGKAEAVHVIVGHKRRVQIAVQQQQKDRGKDRGRYGL